MKIRENCIEWLWGQDTITATLTQPYLITRVRKLSEQHDEVQIVAENTDGSIVAHLPLSYLKFNAPKNLSDEQRQALADRLALANTVGTPECE